MENLLNLDSIRDNIPINLPNPRPFSCGANEDDAILDGVVFIPFAFVGAAANILTNPALDPIGKIPEFKFCAAKVEAAERRQQAAE